ncbi:Hypothetical predicted protein [Paramuricea clavata]|uniref:Uncharacterized protein n=1 Tax=Paramuricea clavata TaxID=317549 RepID=A0A6S7G278_PARCT|nr:Hypothetical predicted protein [Paramuricea clavata]
MEAGMKEEICKMHGYLKTKDVFAFDDALAEKQWAFLLTALTALDHPSEEGPDPDLVKGMHEDALVLLGNANVRLNSWRQCQFSEYLTEVGKRKEEISSDQHLFPDWFHDRIKDEHNHTATNKSLISKLHDKALSSPRFIPSRQPFRGRSGATSLGNGSRKRRKLEDNHSGSLDPTNGTGLQNTSDPFSTPMEIERDQSSITTAAPH